jgi:hypothetical protein
MALGVLLLAPRRVSASEYSVLSSIVFLLTSFATVRFHEPFAADAVLSPEHKILLTLAQFGVMTLAAKLWFSINYFKLSRSVRLLVSFVLYGSLFVTIAGAYWLYKYFPAIQIMLYPLASLAISLTAELIEHHWQVSEHNQKVRR